MREIILLSVLVLLALLVGAACDPDLDAELRVDAEANGYEVIGSWSSD